MSSATVNVRYMVDDVEAAVAWYTQHLGFSLLSNQAPAFADITLGSLRLLQRADKLCGASDARWRSARAWRLESHPPDRE
jgi:catechol 2,3-dioxygenase-like lactoylglutathione lyase family enzyme